MCLHTFPWGRRRRRRGVQLNGDTRETDNHQEWTELQTKARRKKGSEDVDAAGMSDVIFGDFQEVTRVFM